MDATETARDGVYFEAAHCVRTLASLLAVAEGAARFADADHVAARMRSFHNVPIHAGGGMTIGSENKDHGVKLAGVLEARRTAAASLAFCVASLAHACGMLTNALADWTPPRVIYSPTDLPRILPERFAASYAEGVRDLCAETLNHAKIRGSADGATLEAEYTKDVQLGLPGVEGLDGGVMPYGVHLAQTILSGLRGFNVSALENALKIEESKTVASKLEPKPTEGEATTPALSPEVVAKLEAVPAILEEHRTLMDRVARAIESAAAPAAPPTRKLHKLKRWAHEAWMAKQLGQETIQIAKALSEKFNDPRITQPRVSEQIGRAQENYEASGLSQLASGVLPRMEAKAPARTLDPAVAEQGERTDGKAHYLREREAEKAKESDDEE